MRLTILSLIYVLFGIYGWLCIVNCGIALLRLLPRSTFTRQGQRLFAPAWEITQLFLLGGMAALLICFHNGTMGYLRPVVPLLIASTAVIVVRQILVTVLFEMHARSGLTYQNLLFLLITLLLPLCLGAAALRMLTDQAFWQSLTGWILMLTLLVGLLAGGLAFVYFMVGRTPHDRLHQVSRLLNVGLAVFIGVGVQMIASSHLPHLHTLPYDYFIVLGVLTVFWQLGLWLSARERYMWWYLSLLAVLTPLLWGLASRSYVAFPHTPSVRAYSVGSHGQWVIVMLVIFLVALVAATAAIASWLLHFRKHALGS